MSTEERIEQNERLFRRLNERLHEMEAGLAEISGVLSLVCECGDLSCAEQIEMSEREYEDLRSDAAQFAVVRGHEAGAPFETIVMRRRGYLVVRKRD